MIRLQDVHTFYGDSHILKGISFEVGDGELATLLGRNGAGKSTTLKSIMGLVPPKEGRIIFGDKNIFRQNISGSVNWLTHRFPFPKYSNGNSIVVGVDSLGFGLRLDGFWKYNLLIHGVAYSRIFYNARKIPRQE